MRRSLPTVRRHRAGLTFLELLLAVTISGLIISAGAQLMVSFAQLWKLTEEEPRFTHHVDGVTAFIQFCMDHSENLSNDENKPYCWCIPPEQTKPAIHFRLEKSLPFFVTELVPEPPVDAWLLFEEDKGLTLLWHVPRKLTKRKLTLYQTPLSPWVEDLELGYLDTEKNVWEYESFIDEGGDEKREVPQALRIRFNLDGREFVRDLRMSRPMHHVLIY